VADPLRLRDPGGGDLRAVPVGARDRRLPGACPHGGREHAGGLRDLLPVQRPLLERAGAEPGGDPGQPLRADGGGAAGGVPAALHLPAPGPGPLREPPAGGGGLAADPAGGEHGAVAGGAGEVAGAPAPGNPGRPGARGAC
jgi:hypothetical protein